MIKGVLLDLSGVLYTGDEIIPGAIEAVEKLQEKRLPVRFITNTTRTPGQKTINKLAGMGFNIREEEIFTAPMAAKQYILDKDLSPYLLIHPDLAPEFTDISQNKPDCVLVGDAAHEFTYENMNCAFRLLLQGADLLAMGINRYFREGDDYSLDAGPFVNALEYASGCKATVLGKPSPDFFRTAVDSMNCKPGEVIMVGDDVESDVIGALRSGIHGILVKTGKYRPAAEELIEGKAECVDDIAAAVELIMKEK